MIVAWVILEYLRGMNFVIVIDHVRNFLESMAFCYNHESYHVSKHTTAIRDALCLWPIYYLVDENHSRSGRRSRVLIMKVPAGSEKLDGPSLPPHRRAFLVTDQRSSNCESGMS